MGVASADPRCGPPACEECGFDWGSVGPAEVAGAVRAFARRYRAPLTRFLPGEDGDAMVRARPAPGVWSALGYAAHVRDVFGWYRERIERALAEDRPAFAPIDPGGAAASGRYDDLDPAVLAGEVAAAAEALAVVLDGVPPAGWDRVGLRGDEERSVLTAARGAVHEGTHHLLDIGRGLRAVRAAAGR